MLLYIIEINVVYMGEVKFRVSRSTKTMLNEFIVSGVCANHPYMQIEWKAF